MTSKATLNTYFDGKPAWFRGYAETIALYVVSNDREYDITAGKVDPTKLSVHFADCGIQEVWDTDEEMGMEDVFDSFDSRETAACYVSATVSCCCGKYERSRVSVNGTVSEIFSAMFYR
jgi:hypothetical protein